MNIKTGDTVIVLSGDDKGVKGKVIAVSPKEDKVIVEKVNMIHKHVKARKQGDESGIIDSFKSDQPIFFVIFYHIAFRYIAMLVCIPSIV